VTDADGELPPLARVDEPAGLHPALHALGIEAGRPVLVTVGGAAGMEPDRLAPLAELAEHLMRALADWGGAIVDGGTDAGVMRVMGQARRSTGAGLPLIGVAAAGTVIIPGQPAPPDGADLERHHSHLILVPGSSWGDESPWLSRVALTLADGHPSVTLVVNGGQITYDDVEHSLDDGRPVIVLAGTGRTADAIASAADGQAPNERAARIAAAPGTRVVPLDDPRACYSAIEAVLRPAVRR
jgi:SLOG in TRPM, prokaryote